MPRLPATAVPAPAAPTGRPSRIRLSWRRVTAGGPGRSRPATRRRAASRWRRSEEHTSELQSQSNLVCRLLLEQKNATHPPLLLFERQLTGSAAYTESHATGILAEFILLPLHAGSVPPAPPRTSLLGALNPYAH